MNGAGRKTSGQCRRRVAKNRFQKVPEKKGESITVADPQFLKIKARGLKRRKREWQ